MSEKDNKYSQSDSSIESIEQLQTINQALDEDSFCLNREFNGMGLSIKMKGLLLLGLFKRNSEMDKNNKKKFLYRWYVNSHNQKHELAINKLITYGKITTFKFLYKIKIYAKKILTIANEEEGYALNAKDLSQHNLRKSKQRVIDPNTIPKSGQAQKPRSSSRWSKRVSLPKQNSPNLVVSSHRRQKSDNLSTISYKKSQVFQEKKGNLNQKEEIRELLKQQARKLRIMKALDTIQKNKEASIKKIITENQEQIEMAKNEKSKVNGVMQRTDMGQEISIISDKRNYLGNGKDSISYIDPISGEFRIELITCTNIFDNSSLHQGKTNSKATSIIEVLRVVQKIKIKLVNLGFRKLLENMMEQDYEEQLLKAKRNLELVQQNFMIDCQMDSIVQNFQQQTQHFESIDKTIQTLKQKFMYSRAVCLLRVLRKLFLSNLRKFFCSHNDQIRTQKSRRSQEQQQQDNIYEVQELVHASSTSLSNGTSSGAFLRYIQQQESICFNNNAFKIGSLSQALKHQQKQLDK